MDTSKICNRKMSHVNQTTEAKFPEPLTRRNMIRHKMKSINEVDWPTAMKAIERVVIFLK